MFEEHYGSKWFFTACASAMACAPGTILMIFVACTLMAWYFTFWPHMAAINHCHFFRNLCINSIRWHVEFEAVTPAPMSPAMTFKACPAPGMCGWWASGIWEWIEGQSELADACVHFHISYYIRFINILFICGPSNSASTMTENTKLFLRSLGTPQLLNSKRWSPLVSAAEFAVASPKQIALKRSVCLYVVFLFYISSWLLMLTCTFGTSKATRKIGTNCFSQIELRHEIKQTSRKIDQMISRRPQRVTSQLWLS